MIEQKKNDWLATLFFSPDKTPQDLADLGITTDNSSLQNIDYYKNIPQIQEAFKKENGQFDDAAFTNYYNAALTLYNETDKADLIGKVTNQYDYDAFDIFAPIEGKIRNVDPALSFSSNPERRSRGLINLKQLGEPTRSIREVGQSNPVYNYDTGKFEDWTPNDWGGLKALARPTLVLAQWDEDGVHEINGRQVSHKQGDLKFNEYGDPYYETLGGRDLTGKDILHISDTLTVDGSSWNRYDAFDSDGLDKSAAGTIMKAVFNVAPMFIPYVGPVYKTLTAAHQLGKLLPYLSKTIESIATGDTSGSVMYDAANKMQAWFSRFDSSVSDKGKQSFFNIENIGQIIADSSKQLIQQRAIAEIPAYISKIKHAGAISDSAMKWGRGLSLAYMAGTSSMDTYDAFKEAGASDRIAGLGSLATMAVMGKLMNSEYFRDVWYKGTYLDRAKFKNVVKEAAKELSEKEFSVTTKQDAANWVIKAQQAISNRLSKITPGDLLYGMANEGVEETMEEISMDLVKGVFGALNSLGMLEKDSSYNFGITPNNMAERYFTSFIGGALGGAVFNLHGKLENKLNGNISEAISQDKKGLQEMVYLIRNGKTSELYREIDALHSKGALGSTNLSGTEIEILPGEGGHQYQYKPTTGNDSQNDIIARQLEFYVDRLVEITKEEDLDFSDEELAALTFMANGSELSIEEIKNRAKKIQSDEKWRVIEDALINKGFYSQIFNDWNTLTTEIVQTKTSVEQMLTPKAGESQTTKDFDAKVESLKNNSEYKALSSKLKSLREQRDNIIKGKQNDFYIDQLLFAANPAIGEAWVKTFGIHNFTRHYYHKNYEDLSDNEKAVVDNAYKEYTTSKEKDQVITAHKLFYDFRQKMSSHVTNAAKNLKDFTGNYLSKTQLSHRIESVQQELEAKRSELHTMLEEVKDGQEPSEDIVKLQNDVQQLEKELSTFYRYELFQRALPKESSLIRFSKNTNINDIADSYIEYLNDIYSKGLYSDLIDGDLYEILDRYLIEAQFNRGAIESYGFGDTITDEIMRIANALAEHNIPSAMDRFQRLFAEIDSDEGITRNDVFEIIPDLGSRKLHEWIIEVHNKKQQIMHSPIYDLLAEASFVSGLSSPELLNLISQEAHNLINSKNLEEFIIKNPTTVSTLKETLGLIDAIRSTIEASIEGGMNSKVNEFKGALNKELLSEITDVEAQRIINELLLLKSKIAVILEIHESNKAQNLREQRDIAINMRKKFINSIIDTNTIIFNNIKDKLGINLHDLAVECDIPEVVDDSNYQKFEQAVIKFETELYKQLGNKTGIVTSIIDCFDSDELINAAPTKLSKDPNVVVTAFDQMIYLITNIAYPSQNFHSRLSRVISDGSYKLAPIFAQEYAVRIADAFINNHYIMGQISTELHNIASTKEDDYIKNMSNFSNIMAVYGGAGVGKTTGVGQLIRLLNPSAKIVLSAPSESQIGVVDDAGNVSGLKQIDPSASAHTKTSLVNRILGRPVTSKDIDTSHRSEYGDLMYITTNVGLSITDAGLADTDILFIDEISLYDRIDLEIIQEWAKKFNVKVIALGDYKQNEALRIIENNEIPSGLNDGFYVKSPDLVAPLRPDNIAKYDNYILLNALLSKAYDYMYEDKSKTQNDLFSYVDNFMRNNKVSFKYYETPQSFGGEKFVFESDIPSHIESLRKLSSDVVVITDNVAKYKTLGIKAIHFSKVQGQEFDYVIIDKDFEGSKYLTLKDIYTLTQRSRKGTIIARRGNVSDYTSVLDQTSSGNIEIDPEQIQLFKEWRLSNIEGLEEIPFTPQEINNESTLPEVVVNSTDESNNSIVEKIDNIPPIVEAVKPNTDSEDTQSSSKQRIITPAIPKEDICYADEFYEYMRSSSASKYLEHLRNGLPGISSDEDCAVWLNILRSYFIYNHSKDELSIDRFRDLCQEFNLNITDAQIVYKALLENTTMKVIPIKHNDTNKGLLIVELLLNNKKVQIPLLITKAVIGNYTGSIKVASEVTYARGDIDSSINEIPRSMGIRVSDPMILTTWALDKYSSSNKAFVLENKGKTFCIVCADSFVTKQEMQSFATPPKDGDKYTYSISKDPRIRLMGVEWLVDLDNLDNRMSPGTTRKPTLNSERLSSLITHAIKVDPSLKERLLLVIEDELTKTKDGQSINRGVVITTSAGESYTISEWDSNYITPLLQDAQTITFVKIGSENKIYDIDSYNDIADIYNHIFRAQSRGDRSLANSGYEQYKWHTLRGTDKKFIDAWKKEFPRIFGWDSGARSDSDSLWRSPIDSDHDYRTDIQYVYGNNFVLDGKIDPTNDEVIADKVLTRINAQLSKWGKHIVDLKQLPNVIEDINNEIKKSVYGIEYVQLRVENDSIITFQVTDPIALIANTLSVSPASIEFISNKISDFMPFFVSLSDEKIGYVLLNKNSVKEFKAIEEWFAIKNYISAEIWNQLPVGVKDYITEIMATGNNISENVVKNYIKSSEGLTDLQALIDKYLISKLKNNEC